MLQYQELVRVVHHASGFSFGVMRTREGGGKEGDSTLSRPGGMAPPEAHPGTYEFGSVTVEKALTHATSSGLLQKSNDFYGERFDVISQPVDAKGRPGFHRPITYSGILNNSSLSDYDADGNDRSTLSLEFMIDRVV